MHGSEIIIRFSLTHRCANVLIVKGL